MRSASKLWLALWVMLALGAGCEGQIEGAVGGDNPDGPKGRAAVVTRVPEPVGAVLGAQVLVTVGAVAMDRSRAIPASSRPVPQSCAGCRPMSTRARRARCSVTKRSIRASRRRSATSSPRTK